MSYSELLKDPRWQRKRLKIMERHDFKCQRCHDDKTTLNVHHVRYLSKTLPWDYPDDYYRCYCEPCHVNEHEQLYQIDLLLTRLGLCFSSVIELLGGAKIAKRRRKKAKLSPATIYVPKPISPLKDDPDNHPVDEATALEYFRRMRALCEEGK